VQEQTSAARAGVVGVGVVGVVGVAGVGVAGIGVAGVVEAAGMVFRPDLQRIFAS